MTNERTPPANAASYDFAELLALVSVYGKHALYVIHLAWKDRLTRVSMKQSDYPNHSRRSELASAALLLLPGFLLAMSKHKPMEPLTILDEYPHMPASYLILQARNLKEPAIKFGKVGEREHQ